jgi:3-hydroxyacyl-CoA dehydrogenase
MPTTNRQRRPVKRATRRTLKAFVRIVGLDGARATFDAIEAGEGVEGAMKAVRPYLDRYVEANEEVKNTRRDFYRKLERGEI